MTAESPTPYLPRGAGGPLRRAAGRVSGPPALVLEPDPLARLLVAPAVAALGFSVVEVGSVAPATSAAARPARPANAAPAAVFVPLERQDDCRRACEAARAAGWRRDDPAGEVPPLVVGYGAGPVGLLSAHRAHGCADLTVRLAAAGGRPCFVHLPEADVVSAAGLTLREADVLVLLLRGLTTPAVAARLCVAASTARSHCRAVLRKTGATDRRALRAQLLADGSAPPALPVAPQEPARLQVRARVHANFAEEWPVAARRPTTHT